MPRPRPIPPRAQFNIVPNIIKEPKALGRALDVIVSDFNDDKRTENIDLLRVEHKTTDGATGFPVDLILHFAITGLPRYPDSWHVSLLLYNVRIDGFGYERRFRGMDGAWCSGYHRHRWNAETLNADGKEAMSLWPTDPTEMTVREFLGRAFDEMNVSYEDRYATDLL